jgi:PII-like signaling protein
MEKDMLLVRIYLSEAEPGKNRNLMDEVMAILHDQHRVQGVTVYRGISGFGAKGTVHSADLLRLTARLPLVVEFFDEPTVVEVALAALKDLVPSGHLVSWPVRCQMP